MATSNENIRDLINNLRLEMKGDLSKVSDKVDSLSTAQAVSTTKIGMIVTGISIVISGLVSLLMRKI